MHVVDTRDFIPCAQVVFLYIFCKSESPVPFELSPYM